MADTPPPAPHLPPLARLAAVCHAFSPHMRAASTSAHQERQMAHFNKPVCQPAPEKQREETSS